MIFPGFVFKSYYAYEASLQELKDSLNLVVSLEDKWALADRLYDSYAYFNLDSAVTYLGLQKKYARSLKQEYLTALNEVQVMATDIVKPRQKVYSCLWVRCRCSGCD